MEAAENGKEVVVLIELRARFDEANNIEMSKRIEEAGCQILYGLGEYKVHSKLCLITKTNEASGFSYVTQIGTGNYNEKTSRLYTDLSLMTANQDIGIETAKVFDALQKGETVETTSGLLVAPHCLQNRIIGMIDEQIQIAKAGGDAYIGVKVNSLTDKTIIDKFIASLLVNSTSLIFIVSGYFNKFSRYSPIDFSYGINKPAKANTHNTTINNFKLFNIFE